MKQGGNGEKSLQTFLEKPTNFLICWVVSICKYDLLFIGFY